MVIYIFIPDGVQAVHDLWIIGHCFLRDIIGEYESNKLQAAANSTSAPKLYIDEYYNVHEFHGPNMVGVWLASVCIINNLIRAIEERRTLPKLLIVIMDRDGLRDMNVFEDTVPTIIHELIRWDCTTN